jgi:hypothetical protein
MEHAECGTMLPVFRIPDEGQISENPGIFNIKQHHQNTSVSIQVIRPPRSQSLERLRYRSGRLGVEKNVALFGIEHKLRALSASLLNFEWKI